MSGMSGTTTTATTTTATTSSASTASTSPPLAGSEPPAALIHMSTPTYIPDDPHNDVNAACGVDSIFFGPGLQVYEGGSSSVHHLPRNARHPASTLHEHDLHLAVALPRRRRRYRAQSRLAPHASWLGPARSTSGGPRYRCPSSLSRASASLKRSHALRGRLILRLTINGTTGTQQTPLSCSALYRLRLRSTGTAERTTGAGIVGVCRCSGERHQTGRRRGPLSERGLIPSVVTHAEQVRPAAIRASLLVPNCATVASSLLNNGTQRNQVEGRSPRLLSKLVATVAQLGTSRDARIAAGRTCSAWVTTQGISLRSLSGPRRRPVW